MSDLRINARNLYDFLSSKIKENQNSQKEESLFDNTKTNSNSKNDSLYGDIFDFRNNKLRKITDKETNETNNNDNNSNNNEISADDLFVFKYTKYIKNDKTETEIETTTNELSKKDEMLIIEAEKKKEEIKEEEASKITEEESLALQKQLKEITKEYYEKISNKRLKLVYNTNGSDSSSLTEDLSYFSITQNKDTIGEYRITDKDGNVIIPSENDIPSDIKVSSDGSYYTDDGRKYVVISDISDTEYFQNALRNGDLLIEKATVTEAEDPSGDKTDETVKTWSSIAYENLSFIEDHYYTEDDTAAEAEYKAKMEEIYANTSNTVALEDFETAAEKYMDNVKAQELKDKYEEKISNRRLKFIYNTNGSDNIPITEDLSYFNIIQNKDIIGEFRIVDENENIIVPSSEYIPSNATKIGDNYYSTDGKKYIINEDISDSETFRELLGAETLKLQKASTEDEQTIWTITPIEELDFIQDAFYTEDDVQAEAEYEVGIQKLKEEAYLKYLSE